MPMMMMAMHSVLKGCEACVLSVLKRFIQSFLIN